MQILFSIPHANRRFFVFIILVAASFAGSFAQQEQKKNEKELLANGWRKFKTKDLSFLYPGDWKAEKGNAVGAVSIVYAPYAGGEFRDNVNVLVQETGSMTLDAYMELSVSQLSSGQMIKNPVIEKTQTGNLFKMEFGEIFYAGDFNSARFKFYARVYIVDGAAYLFTFTAKEDRFSALEQNAKKIFGSFKLKK